MLGVCLRKLCPQDSFGYAFREKKTVRKSTPEGCKTGPLGVQNGLREASGRLFCASCAAKATQKRSWDAGGALGASWAAPGASRAAPGCLLGVLWGPPRG